MVDFKFLYRNAKCLDPRLRKTLSTALIQCYFDYSCSSWYSGLGSGLTNKLQILQNKVVRFVLDLGPRSRINCDILDSVGMLSVPDRVGQLRINHVLIYIMVEHQNIYVKILILIKELQGEPLI